MSTSQAVKSAEVPWQNVFVAILTLAFANMTQPCGRVLGQSAHLAPWLRSSPIIGLMDSVILATSVLYTAVRKKSLAEGAKQILDARFEVEEEEGWYELRSLERSTLLRWLFTIPPFIYASLKMFGYQGIPKSQAIAYAYALSVLIVEVCIALPFFVRTTRRSSRSDFNFEEERRRRNRTVRKELRAQGDILGICVGLQNACCMVALGRLFADWRTHYSTRWAMTVLSFCVFVYAAYLTFYIGYGLRHVRDSWFAGVRYLRTCTLLCMWLVAIVLAWRNDGEGGYLGVTFYLILCAICDCVVPKVFASGVLPVRSLLGTEIPSSLNAVWLWRRLFLSPICLAVGPWPRTTGSSFEAAVDAFSLAIRTFVIGLLCYLMLYDPSGTSKEWTDILP